MGEGSTVECQHAKRNSLEDVRALLENIPHPSIFFGAFLNWSLLVDAVVDPSSTWNSSHIRCIDALFQCAAHHNPTDYECSYQLLRHSFYNQSTSSSRRVLDFRPLAVGDAVSDWPTLVGARVGRWVCAKAHGVKPRWVSGVAVGPIGLSRRVFDFKLDLLRIVLKYGYKEQAERGACGYFTGPSRVT